MAVRAARSTDIPRLREIEDAAGEIFRTVGMERVADDPPPSAATLAGYVDRGRAWVFDGVSAGVVAGYLLADLVDDGVHIEQVSVDPAFARHGIGAALIEHAARWGVADGRTTITLTTFRDVAWNAPYYARLGFTVIDDAALSPGLVAIRAHEAGLDAWPRVVMRRG
ncbi:MAG TPA: GNAT family N-acetyltransferase [Aldersonia sp.]